eukprot:gb/GECG01001974.1/.p1 GENE.gb/GECG01001974.1/~~gb/GECG01001974.1/.p1  ORF type:complete len:1046 (+),score=164.13 gb/GECG01001974.1/:1-3138(+)
MLGGNSKASSSFHSGSSGSGYRKQKLYESTKGDSLPAESTNGHTAADINLAGATQSKATISPHALEESGGLFPEGVPQGMIDELKVAVRRGNKARVVNLIEDRRYTVDHVFEDSTTPLMNACQTRRENIAMWLLEQNADPHKQTKNKRQTALHLACEQGLLSIVRELVKHMRDQIDIADSSSCTPMHYAAYSGAVHVMQLLALEGASRTPRTERGFTPLYMLVYSEKTTDVQKAVCLHYLFSFPEWRHPDIINARSAKRSGGLSRETPLMLATRTGLVNTVRALLSTGDAIDVTNEQSRDNRDKSPLEICSTALNNARHALSKQRSSQVPALEAESTVSPAFNFGMDLSPLRQYTFDHPRWNETLKEDYIQPTVEEYCTVYGLKLSEIFNDAVLSVDTSGEGNQRSLDKKYVKASDIVTFNGRREYANIPQHYFDVQQRGAEADAFTAVSVFEAIQKLLNNRIASQRGQPALSETELVQLFSDDSRTESSSSRKGRRSKPKRTSERTSSDAAGGTEIEERQSEGRKRDENASQERNAEPVSARESRQKEHMAASGPVQEVSSSFAVVNPTEAVEDDSEEWVTVGQARAPKKSSKSRGKKERRDAGGKDARDGGNGKQNKTTDKKSGKNIDADKPAEAPKRTKATHPPKESDFPPPVSRKAVASVEGVSSWKDLVQEPRTSTQSNATRRKSADEVHAEMSRVPDESKISSTIHSPGNAAPMEQQATRQEETSAVESLGVIQDKFPELDTFSVSVENVFGLGDLSSLPLDQLEAIKRVLLRSEKNISAEIASRKEMDTEKSATAAFVQEHTSNNSGQVPFSEKPVSQKPKLKAEAREFEPSTGWKDTAVTHGGGSSSGSLSPPSPQPATGQSTPWAAAVTKSTQPQTDSASRVPKTEPQNEAKSEHTPASAPESDTVASFPNTSLESNTVPFGSSWANLAASASAGTGATPPRLKVVARPPAAQQQEGASRRAGGSGSGRGGGNKNSRSNTRNNQTNKGKENTGQHPKKRSSDTSRRMESRPVGPSRAGTIDRARADAAQTSSSKKG